MSPRFFEQVLSCHWLNEKLIEALVEAAGVKVSSKDTKILGDVAHYMG